MSKNMLEDIKPISRSPRTTSSSATVTSSPVGRPKKVLPREVPFEPSQRGPHHGGYGLWYIAGICIVGLLFSLSFLFEHATVTILPKSVPAVLDAGDVFTAHKDSTDPEQVVFTVMTLSGEESIRLPSTETKTLSEPAKGRVVLYNAYTTTPYSLVKNTRLQSPDGKIYRIDSAVKIPGYKGSGANLVPGSIEVSVTAGTTGEAGNLGMSDFSIPGLAGTTQATKIYGRSKTEMTGGVSGTVYTIPQASADAAMGSLAEKLKASLSAKAKVQIPDGYLFYPGATIFVSGDAVQAPYSKDSEVPISLSGTMSAYLIQEDSLVRAIAKRFISQYGDEPVSVENLTALELSSTGEALSPDTDTTFAFALQGSTSVVWTINEEEVREKLSGNKKSAFEELLAQFTGIEQAEVVVRPFWKQSFPKNAGRISVDIKAVQ